MARFLVAVMPVSARRIPSVTWPTPYPQSAFAQLIAHSDGS
jgi:hypothetical protein